MNNHLPTKHQIKLALCAALNNLGVRAALGGRECALFWLDAEGRVNHAHLVDYQRERDIWRWSMGHYRTLVNPFARGGFRESGPLSWELSGTPIDFACYAGRIAVELATRSGFGIDAGKAGLRPILGDREIKSANTWFPVALARHRAKRPDPDAAAFPFLSPRKGESMAQRFLDCLRSGRVSLADWLGKLAWIAFADICAPVNENSLTAGGAVGFYNCDKPAALEALASWQGCIASADNEVF